MPHRSEREVLEDVLDGVRQIQRALKVTGSEDTSAPSNQWEDFYIRGVNLANQRGTQQTNIDALRAQNDAIALSPTDLDENMRSRLHTYRGAILKRLMRLQEAEQDLVLGRKWAREAREVDDADYNLTGVLAMQGRSEEAIELLVQLVSRNPRWYSVVEQKREYFGQLAAHPRIQLSAKPKIDSDAK